MGHGCPEKLTSVMRSVIEVALCEVYWFSQARSQLEGAQVAEML